MSEGVPALVLAVPRSRAEAAVAMLRTYGAGLRRFGRGSGPGLLAAALALAACTSSSAPPQPQTARVERTTVVTAVTSSGALAASSEQNLGFRTGGRLTAVEVQVGDRVTPVRCLRPSTTARPAGPSSSSRRNSTRSGRCSTGW